MRTISDDLEELYAQARYLDLERQLEKHGGLEALTGPARTFASRLASNLGGMALSQVYQLRAWRESPEQAAAAARRLELLATLRSPLDALCFVRERGDGGVADRPHDRADWWWSVCHLHLSHRDFTAATEALDRAEQAAPGDAYTLVCRGSVAAARDRREKAVSLAQEALARRPHSRSAVELIATLLTDLGRHDEALAAVAAGEAATQAGRLSARLAAMLEQRDRPAEALACLDRFVQRSPLLDAQGLRWLAVRRSDLHYQLGDLTAAEAEARRVGTEFHTRLADRLAARAPPERVVLAVPWIRQDHLTCAPATLAMIARFWGVAAEHRAVADLICYDGTPDHRERRWAEDAGFTVREFTVTLASARLLLDHGIPFTLTTRGSDYGHLQAVVGYDARRGSFLVREPAIPWLLEVEVEPLLQKERLWGPRGMALVPSAHAALLAGLDLPDAGLRNRLHQVREALARNDREAAQVVADQVRADAPDHVLAIHIRRELAWYDGDIRNRAATTRLLLERYPGHPDLLLIRLDELREVGTLAERLALIAQAGPEETLHPVLRRALGVELTGDPRHAMRSDRILRRALRHEPGSARTWSILARLRWIAGDRALATAAWRAAARAEWHNGDLALTWARALHWTGQRDPALAILEARRDELGSRQAEPHLTLAAFLDQTGRAHEALAGLEAVLSGGSALPEVERANLHLALARRKSGLGQFDQARTHLAAARSGATPAWWLRAAAELAEIEAKTGEAISHWRAVLDLQPQVGDANGSVARLLARTDGGAAALAHLAAACARFPHASALAEIRLGWLRIHGDPAQRIAMARQFTARHDDNAWGWRELAFACLDHGAIDDAAAALAQARLREPDTSWTLNLVGDVAWRQQRFADARAAWRQAIAGSVDNRYAIDRLIQTAGDPSAARADLDLVASELRRQVTDGSGLEEWSGHVRRLLGPEATLAVLGEAHAARPDLPTAWNLLSGAERDLGHQDAALALATTATERFPLEASVWWQLRLCEQARGAHEAEVTALRRCCELDPGSAFLLRELALRLEQLGRPGEALPLFERICATWPTDAYGHGCLADHLLSRGDPSALDRLEQACRLDAAYQYAWRRLGDLAPERALALARGLAAERPGDPEIWMRLAELLGAFGPGHADERISAARRAFAAAPMKPEAITTLAWALASAGKVDEATAVCSPPGLSDPFLRLTAARIYRKAGNHAKARELLTALLADLPADRLARLELSDLLESLGESELAIAEGETAVRHHPTNAVAWGHLASAQETARRTEAARASYARALALDPGYGFAAAKTVDLALEAGDAPAATAAIPLLRRSLPGPWTECRAVRAAAAAKDRLAAFGALDALIISPSAEPASIEEALTACDRAGWRQEVLPRLELTVRAGTDAPRVAESWLRRRLARDDLDRVSKIVDALLDQKTGSDRLVIAWLDQLASPEHGPRLQRFLTRHRVRLLSSDACWGEMGYALLNANGNAAAAAWMADWRQRPKAAAWMLGNLAIALRRMGLDGDASAVSRAALPLAEDGAGFQHRLWLSLDAALAGDTAQAAALLLPDPDHPRPTDASKYWICIEDLARAALAVGTPGELAFAWRRLDAFCERNADHLRIGAASPELRRLWLAILQRTAATEGTWMAWWGAWRRRLFLV